MARTLGGAPASAFDTLTIARGVRCRRRYPRKAPPVADLRPSTFDPPVLVADAAAAREPLTHRVAPDSTGRAAASSRAASTRSASASPTRFRRRLSGIAFRQVGDDLLLLDLSTGERWPRR
jgi:hypothetical protein